MIRLVRESRLWQSLLLHLQRKKLQKQLAPMVRHLITTLNTGRSLQAALHEIAKQTEPPLAHELQKVLRQYQAGSTLKESFALLLERHPGEDMELFVAAITFSATSGGSITETLKRLEATLIHKQRLNDKIKALTAQAKLQGWVMICMPILLLLAIPLVDRHFLTPLFHTNVGRLLLGAMFLSNLFGLLWICKLTRPYV